MRFLADESCDFAVVRALRAAGHDVLSAAEISRRSDDETVIRLGVEEARILITEDRDFGRLVYSRTEASVGVLFLRFPARARSRLPEVVSDLVARSGRGWSDDSSSHSREESAFAVFRARLAARRGEIARGLGRRPSKPLAAVPAVPA